MARRRRHSRIIRGYGIGGSGGSMSTTNSQTPASAGGMSVPWPTIGKQMSALSAKMMKKCPAPKVRKM